MWENPTQRGEGGVGFNRYEPTQIVNCFAQPLWKNMHNTTKNKVHIHVVYFFKLVICPVVRVFH
jgi:hypothetical protein